MFERSAPKICAALGIVLIHVLVFEAVTRSFGGQGIQAAQASGEFVATAQIYVQSDAWDRAPLPEVELEPVAPLDTAPRMIQFDDSVQDELAGITGPASAPHLSRVQSADIIPFAQRAHIRSGHPLTVVLIVKVLEDGSVGEVDVSRSSGNPDADAAAVDYALELRWVPGTREREPRVMRVNLPVTLSVPPTA